MDARGRRRVTRPLVKTGMGKKKPTPLGVGRKGGVGRKLWALVARAFTVVQQACLNMPLKGVLRICGAVHLGGGWGRGRDVNDIPPRSQR